jgi:ribosomal protein L18E
MRYFHKTKQQFHRPTINLDKLYSLLTPQGRAREAKKDDKVTVIDVTAAGFFKVLGKGVIPQKPVIVKAKFFSKKAEKKIKDAGGVLAQGIRCDKMIRSTGTWGGVSPHGDGRVALRGAAGLALTWESDARAGLHNLVERHVEELPRVRVRAVTSKSGLVCLFTSGLIVTTIHVDVDITRLMARVSQGPPVRVVNIHESRIPGMKSLINVDLKVKKWSGWVEAGNSGQQGPITVPVKGSASPSNVSTKAVPNDVDLAGLDVFRRDDKVDEVSYPGTNGTHVAKNFRVCGPRFHQICESVSISGESSPIHDYDVLRDRQRCEDGIFCEL